METLGEVYAEMAKAIVFTGILLNIVLKDLSTRFKNLHHCRLLTARGLAKVRIASEPSLRVSDMLWVLTAHAF